MTKQELADLRADLETDWRPAASQTKKLLAAFDEALKRIGELEREARDRPEEAKP